MNDSINAEMPSGDLDDMYFDSLKEQAEKLNLDKEDGSAVAA